MEEINATSGEMSIDGFISLNGAPSKVCLYIRDTMCSLLTVPYRHINFYVEPKVVELNYAYIHCDRC